MLGKFLPDNIVTFEEWQRITGLSRRMVYHLIQQGTLTAVQIQKRTCIVTDLTTDERYIVSHQAVADYREQHGEWAVEPHRAAEEVADE